MDPFNTPGERRTIYGVRCIPHRREVCAVVYDLDEHAEAARAYALKMQTYWATHPKACEPGCESIETFVIRDMFTGSTWVDEPEA